eukprot:TRINITY_DN8356_c0_g1_i1.p1 TRINITY_DN8356_c0_g1~~TRINITY_DN8356_c0_g1_i1.p1  ORF type:complete len:444 (-),score=119.75 TRINITY_DN8356_c0_g1_i1:88-1377(-)
MGTSLSRPKLAAVAAGGGLIVALTCWRLATAAEEEENTTPPIQALRKEQRDAVKDKNAKLRKAAEQIILENLPIKETQRRLHAAFTELAGQESPAQPSLQEKRAKAEPRPRDEDLITHGLLGCGGFGAVELVEDKASGKTFALKSMSKGYIMKTGMQESARNELVILKLTDSPFVVKLHASYNRKQHICFLMDLCLGGELYATYNRKGFHGSIEHAQYYIGSLVLGIAHLHSIHVICRGIKPEDCVIDSTGKMKLCDMGLAKLIVGKTFTTCGTPDYFAPELIKSDGHHFPVDWWCVGIMLYELLAAHPPFESSYPMQIYSKVMKGIDKVSFPEATKDAKTLIKSLCKQNPEERLPMQAGGVENIKKDSFFGGFDWEALEQQRLEAPYIPIVKSVADLSNFSARKEDVPETKDFVDDGSGWADIFEAVQ